VRVVLPPERLHLATALEHVAVQGEHSRPRGSHEKELQGKRGAQRGVRPRCKTCRTRLAGNRVGQQVAQRRACSSRQTCAARLTCADSHTHRLRQCDGRFWSHQSLLEGGKLACGSVGLGRDRPANEKKSETDQTLLHTSSSAVPSWPQLPHTIHLPCWKRYLQQSAISGAKTALDFHEK
jgi:hypothetical protein